jgi:PhnB protein
MGVNPIPESYARVTPYLINDDAGKVLDFAKNAFGAEERMRIPGPNDSIGHAEMAIGGSIVMLGDAGGEWTAMPAYLYVYVEDVDATFARALEAGGTSVKEPEDQFYGDRTATVRDTAGNMWGLATHVEDVSEEDMAKRLEEFTAQQA